MPSGHWYLEAPQEMHKNMGNPAPPKEQTVAYSFGKNSVSRKAKKREEKGKADYKKNNQALISMLSKKGLSFSANSSSFSFE